MISALFLPLSLSADAAVVRFRRHGDTAWTTLSVTASSAATAPVWVEALASVLDVYAIHAASRLDPTFGIRVSLSSSDTFSIDITEGSLLNKLGFASGSQEEVTILHNVVVPDLSLLCNVMSVEVERFPYQSVHADSLDAVRRVEVAQGTQERLRLTFGPSDVASSETLSAYLVSSLRQKASVSLHTAGSVDVFPSCLNAPWLRFLPIVDGELAPTRIGSAFPAAYSLTLSAEVLA